MRRIKSQEYAITDKQTNITRVLPLTKIAQILESDKRNVLKYMENNKLETPGYIVTVFQYERTNHNMSR